MTTTSTPETRVTRATARRGDTVTVTTRNGETWTGTVTGWGAQIMEVAPDAASQDRNGRHWKRVPFAVGNIESVVRP